MVFSKKDSEKLRERVRSVVKATLTEKDKKILKKHYLGGNIND